MLTKETQEKADCRINRNRNGRGTRRSETGYMDQSQRKLNQKMMIEMVLLMILMVGTSSEAKMLKLWSL